MILALRNAGTQYVSATHPEPGMVVGGGGTARAAIYALKNMGYSPIYLVGRNKAKLTDLASAFDSSYNVKLLASEADARALQPKEHPTVAIGTIPGDSPIDPSMREILCHIFQASAPDVTGKGGKDQKVLLEMAYKPAITSLMQLASNSGWKAVPGLEALVGQGIHQFRLWTDIVPLFDMCREAVMGKKE
jgi:pentafunctional AROM polypeptide